MTPESDTPERRRNDTGVIIDHIDDGTLHPRRHAVCRELARHLTGLIDAERQFLAAFDRGEALDRDFWARHLWKRIDALPHDQAGGLRILVGLNLENEELDFYEAGFLIDFGRQQGIADADILSAFGMPPRE